MNDKGIRRRWCTKSKICLLTCHEDVLSTDSSPMNCNLYFRRSELSVTCCSCFTEAKWNQTAIKKKAGSDQKPVWKTWQNWKVCSAGNRTVNVQTALSRRNKWAVQIQLHRSKINKSEKQRWGQENINVSPLSVFFFTWHWPNKAFGRHEIYPPSVRYVC